ncbi:Protein of unknown function [Bacillus thuringiensis]|uniref:Uncharacterized protein n=1 Tax=Bacillus thuringiensis TaxID=1428 RepID=A0A1C4EQ23_BACTU|nr:Protein of unknown function [Bacillus thuringiensis]
MVFMMIMNVGKLVFNVRIGLLLLHLVMKLLLGFPMSVMKNS